MKKHYFLFFSIISIFLNAQSFSPDPTFGNGGYCMFDNFDLMSDAVLLPDGQFITATSTGSITIRKVNQSGILDATFGEKNYDMGSNSLDKSESVKRMILSNNKILIYGRVNATPTHSLYDWFLTRINLDGSLDTSFGTNGFTTQSVSQNGTVNDFAVDQNGNSFLLISNMGSYMVKVNQNGVIDNNFGTNGKLSLNTFYPKKFYIQNDGKLVMAGTKTNTLTNTEDSYIERRLPDGTYDTTFGNNGSVFIPNTAGSVATNFEYNYTDNSILLLHSKNATYRDTFFLSKIQISDGASVSGFSNNGRTPDYHFTTAQQLSLGQITVLPNSKIVVTGGITNMYNGTPNLIAQLFVTRLNANGTVDYTTSSAGFQYFMAAPPTTSLRADYIHKLFNLNDGSLVLCYSGGSVTHGDKSFLTKFNSGFLGIDNVSLKDYNTFTLYPNPAGDHITIQNKKQSNESFEYSIFDMSGKKIQSGFSIFNEQMNIQKLEKGNYMIWFETKKGDKQSLKLIKK
ncbi:T9SS type A sorting domain-containing protein [Chryseobacterium sp. S0630]|uniref:T9SS type A sorting domain-containing protein n=1 Tax=unclassified Chryseobacterium TaxID=2593645 RepID=UPI000AA95312|nr:T9SS type A sorting domain-containing protein [Chryseobacterium sp. S0630]MCP1301303.1 T9SS type A sorting domain-containing protein [Chryseobacterium sp. S0630]